MRTFGIHVAGWIAGAAVVVALGAPATRGAGGSPSVPPPAGRAHMGSATGAYGADLLIPVAGITSTELRDNYSQPRGRGRTHRALDILAPRGTPVVAAVDGTIRKLDRSAAGGITIYQFDRDEKRVYYYAHLDRYADVVAEGLFVTQGTVIGYVGTSGNAPVNTPHLHFSVEDLTPTKEWWKGTPVNPYPLLTGSGR